MIYIDFGALSRILLVNFGVYWVPSATIMVVKVQKCKGRHILLRFLSKSYQYLAPHDTLATLRPSGGFQLYEDWGDPYLSSREKAQRFGVAGVGGLVSGFGISKLIRAIFCSFAH